MSIAKIIEQNLSTYLIEPTEKNSTAERETREKLENMITNYSPFLHRFEMRVFKVQSKQQNNFMMNIIDGAILGYLMHLKINGEHALPEALKGVRIDSCLESIEPKSRQDRKEIIKKLFGVSNQPDPQVENKWSLSSFYSFYDNLWDKNKEEKRRKELENFNSTEWFLNDIIDQQSNFKTTTCDKLHNPLEKGIKSLENLLNIFIGAQGTIDRKQEKDFIFKPTINDKLIGLVIYLNDPEISIGVFDYNRVRLLDTFISESGEGLIQALEQTSHLSENSSYQISKNTNKASSYKQQDNFITLLPSQNITNFSQYFLVANEIQVLTIITLSSVKVFKVPDRLEQSIVQLIDSLLFAKVKDVIAQSKQTQQGLFKQIESQKKIYSNKAYELIKPVVTSSKDYIIEQIEGDASIVLIKRIKNPFWMFQLELGSKDYEFIQEKKQEQDSDFEICEKEPSQYETNSIMEVEDPLSKIIDLPVWKITPFEDVPKCKQCKLRNVSCLAAQLCRSCIRKFVSENM